MTKEHFISRNILEQLDRRTLRFENAGHLFGGKTSVEVGLDNFSAKVLCDNHNSMLSPLDSSVGRTFADLESLVATLESTESRLLVASGIDLERWLTKVYCGLTAARAIRGDSGAVVELQSLAPLLRSVAGLEVLPEPLGLYFNYQVGMDLKAKSFSIGTIKLTDGSDEVGGLILSLGLMSLVLVISRKYAPGAFHDPNWHRHVGMPIAIKDVGRNISWVCTFQME